ncbi:hypothetical protein NP590_10145 [Methylomonas sp. SURF-2]|uniref:Elongation factor-1 alpha n=1 Tax=Methylomonas subterranea TaxID=2952225 RepID=A0ABT1TGU5_9GAMM|nr:hypothetical protein [Methylomonas sp. SURF-2]MCQ8104463.1 hypothetical protein [Methylomonas sp. SURF-2]
MANCQRFSDISISERILNSLFLLSIALGYLFSLGQVFFAHQGRDGQPGLSIADIAIAYHGSPEQTRLAAAINGPMAGNLKSPADRIVILDWIASGAGQAVYHAQVAPILRRDCVACHSPASGMNLPSLTSYEQVVILTEADRGASIPSLVRVSHIHLFGIAFILFFVGKLFVLCEIPVWLKRLTIGIPFMSMLTDIFAWYLTRETPEFAYLLVLSGGLMGLSLNFQIILSLYQMWLPEAWAKSLQSRLSVSASRMALISGRIWAKLIRGWHCANSVWKQWLNNEANRRNLVELNKLFLLLADRIKKRLRRGRRLF